MFFCPNINLKCDKKLMDLELMIFHPATVKLNVETLMLNVFKVISGQIIWKQILSVYFFRHFLCREAYRSIVLGSFGAFCWVFRVQGFHNRHCEWTDALVVRPGLRVCFALMALTHGPTYSLKICFLNWRSLVLTSGWTHFSGFPPVFFFFLHWLVLFHGIGPTLQEMPGVFGIRWNHLWLLIFFLYSCWWGPGWLICGSSSVFCLTFSFCTWTRPDCLVHLFVLMQVLDGTLRSEIRNMCPSERSDVFLVFFFTTLGGSALGMTTLICQLVQTEISQQTQDRLPWNFFIDIHGAQRIIPADFSLSATMRLAFVVSSEVF